MYFRKCGQIVQDWPLIYYEAMANDASSRHLVKRYSLARLYDTTTGTYVDVAQLRALVRAGAEVIVLDAKTEEDVTSTFLRLDIDRKS